MTQHSRQGGWLAMEALIAIVISSMMVAGAVTMYASSEKNIDKEQVSMGLVQLAENIHKGFSTRSDYTGISESVVNDLGLMPTAFVAGGPDGAELSVVPAPDSAFDIIIEFAGTESAKSWCADLLPNGARTWLATGAGGAPGEGLLPEMTVDEAMSACDGSTVFTFRRM